jgi:hypothetical protein
MSRCEFCNNALLGFGEVVESGKTYHQKCAPSARGTNFELARTKFHYLNEFIEIPCLCATARGLRTFS